MNLSGITGIPINEGLEEYKDLGHDQMELIEESPRWWSDFKNGAKSGYKNETDRQNVARLNKEADTMSLEPQEEAPHKPAEGTVDYEPVGRAYSIKKGPDIAKNWNSLDPQSKAGYQHKYMQQLTQFVQQNPQLRTKVIGLLAAELKRQG